MYINTFKYTPKDVSCQLCTEYVKKLGCTALRCPWLAERIEAGVVGYWTGSLHPRRWRSPSWRMYVSNRESARAPRCLRFSAASG